MDKITHCVCVLAVCCYGLSASRKVNITPASRILHSATFWLLICTLLHKISLANFFLWYWAKEGREASTRSYFYTDSWTKETQATFCTYSVFKFKIFCTHWTQQLHFNVHLHHCWGYKSTSCDDVLQRHTVLLSKHSEHAVWWWKMFAFKPLEKCEP